MYKLGGGVVIGKWEKEKEREVGRRGCRWNTKWEMERGEGGMWEIKKGNVGFPALSGLYRPHPIIRNHKKFLRVRVVRPLQGLGNLLYLELGPAR